MCILTALPSIILVTRGAGASKYPPSIASHLRAVTRIYAIVGTIHLLQVILLLSGALALFIVLARLIQRHAEPLMLLRVFRTHAQQQCYMFFSRAVPRSVDRKWARTTSRRSSVRLAPGRPR